MIVTLQIEVAECLMVRPGDRFGFTVVDARAPIAAEFDASYSPFEKPTYIRDAADTGSFDMMFTPLVFSFGAVYDETQTC